MLRQLSFFLILFIVVVSFSGSLLLFFWNDISLLEIIKDFHSNILEFHQNHPITTPFLFISTYILYAFFALPGIFILSVLAGFLFPQPLSTIYVAFSATMGATLLFATARFAMGDYLYKKSNHILKKLEQGFHENSVSFLLFLRLIPVFPFWGINLASAYFGVPFSVFVWTTFIGMLPTIVIFTQAGQNIQEIFNSSEPFNPSHFLNTKMALLLTGLATLSLIPIFFKKFKKEIQNK